MQVCISLYYTQNLHIGSHILKPIMRHASFQVWTCCRQRLIQPGLLFPCSRSVSVNIGFLFSCFSPVQMFAVTETSITQAASCLIDELPQRCDSHTLAHGFFCFSLHISKKLHFLPFSIIFAFIFESLFAEVYCFFIKMQSEIFYELWQAFIINTICLTYFILIL